MVEEPNEYFEDMLKRCLVCGGHTFVICMIQVSHPENDTTSPYIHAFCTNCGKKLLEFRRP